MITENLSTLKINKLTQAQYDRELAADNIDENAIYLTPDDSATGFVADQIYNPESENAQSGKALAPVFQSKISMWQSKTEYKVGDLCLYVFPTNSGDNENPVDALFLYECKQDHTSTDIHLDNSYWNRKDITVSGAIKDGLGRYIAETYATKDDVGSIETALDNIIAIQNQLIGGDSI